VAFSLKKEKDKLAYLRATIKTALIQTENWETVPPKKFKIEVMRGFLRKSLE